MKALLVADTRSHARATMRWCNYKEEHWDIALYGGLLECTYSLAMLARPVGDITEDHALWVSHVLRPRVAGRIDAVPGWTFEVRHTALIEDLRDFCPNPRAMWN